MDPIIVALLSLSSAVLVAVLGHVLSTRRKQRDELMEMRLKASTDFINAASRLIAARRIGRTEDELNDLAALNDAKVRICICAEPNVVRALAKFWEEGGTLEKEGETLAFTRFCLRIRESLGNARDLHDLDLSNTLFRLQPSSYSFKAAPCPMPLPEQLQREARRLNDA